MAPPDLNLAPPLILPVATGKSESDISNKKGHLFERFMARVFEAYGCEKPTSHELNLRSIGIELDISTRIVLSREAAIAECKAYSANVSAALLSQFYGKLAARRLTEPSLHGWFVAIPRLTADGHQLAKKIEESDRRFRLVVADDVAELVQQQGWVPGLPSSVQLASDLAIVLSEDGLFGAAKQLDPSSRLPTAVLVWSQPGEAVPASTLSAVESSSYAAQLPVRGTRTHELERQVGQQARQPTLVEVVGSRSDFEYQFPASPEYFVGRKALLSELKQTLSSRDTQPRVFVLNAQSGWGKSSVALRLGKVVAQAKGCAVVLDTRTAEGPDYVAASLRKVAAKAERRGVIALPHDASFGSVQSGLSTLARSEWKVNKGPILLFFDQFENVFQHLELTREFRNLALSLASFAMPVFLGFAWKTDLVGWTEKHPYRMRDEIRSAANLIQIGPLGPKEVGTVVSRLAKAANRRVSPDLRRRIQEYSQGLPWLLKKLGSHLLAELQGGTSEEELLDESLNIQGLFQRDLSELQPEEVEALRGLARAAPVAVSEFMERVPPGLVQSLVDRRLVVRVGGNLDVYWDTFRDFLNTGRVAIEDTYILRQRPASSGRVLRAVLDRGGDVEVDAVADALSTSRNVIFNAARDLRQLGILTPAPKRLRVSTALRDATREEEFRARAARSLRRHRALSLAETAADSAGGRINTESFAELLPTAFPAVEAAASTWQGYATNFAEWFDYAGLVTLRGQEIAFAGDHSPTRRLLKAPRSGLGAKTKTFPYAGPANTVRLARAKLGLGAPPPLGQSALGKAEGNLYVLGLVDDAGSPGAALRHLFEPDGTVNRSRLKEHLESLPITKPALEALEQDPCSSAAEVGELLRRSQGVNWGEATIALAGKHFRAWARAAGVAVAHRRHRRAAGQLALDAGGGSAAKEESQS